ncbi:hypothetical protein [Streptomyces viridochromogenes]|uniref:hypothetical protein n=1 Tax=Streptomyces viridochromogenes TaxID=1938 RepID=UPI00069D4830|nr:hypothetical protein [Streptomyces viridochromogenes]
MVPRQGVLHLGRLPHPPGDTFEGRARVRRLRPVHARDEPLRTGTTAARHFTLFSLQHGEGSSARLDEDIPAELHMMNPMYHLVEDVNEKRSKH